ncbi:MAG: BMP family ABC transporter substrate-binding protein [Oscillospiraceae bacterium]|jgi:basic membrane protein A|nr:BMP family ABC transporter substrate-binding protein [Oscillospiraceae bacterium]
MLKKIFALLLCIALTAALFACKKNDPKPSGDKGALTKDNIIIGVVLVGAEDDNGYNFNHMEGIKEMAAALGIKDEQIIVKRNIPETDECRTALIELATAGANIIFADSFGHEDYVLEVANDYPNIQFAHATGYKAAGSELTNVHNYFTKIFEARYLSGIVAGLKAKEIGNPKLGYVGAFPFAEVISGYTAFYLGAKSVYPEVTMDVMFTNSWSDPTLEAQTARALIERGAGVISQHSDTTAPATTAAELGAFQVGYNADMISAAPTASLVSARVKWGVYYTYAVKTLLDGGTLSTDWCQGFTDGAVYLSPLNDAIVAAGTKEAVAAAEEKLRGGLHVFSGDIVVQAFKDAGKADSLTDGAYYDESASQSAPSFEIDLPGITKIQ